MNCGLSVELYLYAHTFDKFRLAKITLNRVQFGPEHVQTGPEHVRLESSTLELFRLIRCALDLEGL